MKSRCILRVMFLIFTYLPIFGFAEKLVELMPQREVFFDTSPPSYLLNTIILDENIDQRLEGTDDVNSFVKNNDNLESSRLVSMQEAAYLILKAHPRVRQMRSIEEGEREMINVAKSGYYPQVKGGVDSRYDNYSSNRYDKDYLQSINLEINQNIYDFGRTDSAVKSSEYGYLGAKAYASMTDEELVYTATSTVVSIVSLSEFVGLANSQVEQVASIGRLVEARYDRGASNMSDVLQARSRLDLVQSEALVKSSQKQSHLKALGILIENPYLDNAVLGKLPSELSLSCSQDPNWDHIPEFLIAEFELQRAFADLDVARSEELPSISLQGRTSRPLNATSRYGSKFETSVSLNVSVPLYQGGRLSANERAAANRAQAASAKREEVKLEINRRLSDAQIRLDYMLKRQSLLAQQVENLRGTKELYKKQYLDLGTRSLLDLLNAEQEYHQAQIEVERNKSEIIQTRLDCAFFQGKLRSYFKTE